MTMRSTSNQGAPYPDVNEPLNNVNDWIYALAQFFERRAGARYANMSALSSKLPSPNAGDSAWIVDTKVLLVFDGSTWVRVYPSSPQIFFGATDPSSGLGSVNDIYFKTS